MAFRFVVTAPEITDVRSWKDELRRIEDAGFDAVGVADPPADLPSLFPLVARLAGT